LIKSQLTRAKLLLAKDLGDFAFADTPVNETLVRGLAFGALPNGIYSFSLRLTKNSEVSVISPGARV
jgi:hypothetical protein